MIIRNLYFFFKSWTELFSVSFIIFATSFFVLSLKYKKIYLYFLTSFLLFYTYQIRPSFIVYIFFFPAYIFFKNFLDKANYKIVLSNLIKISFLSILPFIIFVFCRILITDHFGITPFAGVNIAGMAGFNAMHALSKRNESPESASRPFDATRDGFVLGEGAGTLILEEYEHAIKRGAKIYAEFLGGGLSSDAYHITAPHPEGNGVKAVIKNCLNDSKVSIQDVDLINTHGTSTPLGDVAELKAIDHIFTDHAPNININSNKSMTGHLLGAAGAVEAISIILSLKNGIVPPTINHQNIDENINPKLNLTLNKAQKREAKIGMSNTFGFGGHNACVLFKKWD